MSTLDTDIEALENAVRMFGHTMKRPQHWTTVKDRAKASIDRPFAVLLQMLLLSEQGFCRVQDLAVKLGIEPPSVTRKTQELEQAGYVRRVPDPADRRGIDLRITPRGRAIANRIWKAQRAMLGEALQHWQPADRRQFVKLFERFSNDLLTASMPKQPASRRQTQKGAVHA